MVGVFGKISVMSPGSLSPFWASKDTSVREDIRRDPTFLFQVPINDFHITHGGLVFREPVYQPSSNLDKLIKWSELSRASLLGVLSTAANQIRSGTEITDPYGEMFQTTKTDMSELEKRYTHLYEHGFVLAPNKDIGRIHEKIEHEKGGNADLITDIVRGMLIVDTPEELARAQRFFAPGAQENVLEYSDGFSASGEFPYRRMKVLYRLSGNIVAEIQIVSKKSIPHLLESHEAYEDMRSLEAQWEQIKEYIPKHEVESHEVYVAYQEAKKRRKEANEKANEACQNLTEKHDRQFEYYIVNDIPVVKAINGTTKFFQPFIGRDGKMRWKRKDIDSEVALECHKDNQVTREDFYRRAQRIYLNNLNVANTQAVPLNFN